MSSKLSGGLIELQTIKSKESDLGMVSIIDGARDLPFHVERVYHIHGVRAGATRGYHAHRKLEQLLICMNGAIKIILDDGERKKIFVLDDPSRALFVRAGVWRTMEWLVDNSVLVVLASAVYDENDYIRNYEEFLVWGKRVRENENTI